MASGRKLVEVLLTDVEGDAQGNATYTLYEIDGTTPLAQSVYANASGGVALSQPLSVDTLGEGRVYVQTAQRLKVGPTGGTAYMTGAYPDPSEMVLLDDAQTLVGRKTFTNAGKITFGASGKLMERLDEALPLSYGGTTSDYLLMGFNVGTAASPDTADGPVIYVNRNALPSRTDGEETVGHHFQTNMAGSLGAKTGLRATNFDYHNSVHSVTATATGSPYNVIALTAHMNAGGTSGGTGLIVAAKVDAATAGAQGIEIDIQRNYNATLDNFDPTSYPPPVAANTGLNILGKVDSGAVNNGQAIYIQANDANSKFWYGIQFAPNAIQSSASGGTYTHRGVAIDLVNITGGARPIRLPNGGSVFALNAAGTGELATFLVNGANQLELRNDLAIILADAAGSAVYGTFTSTGLTFTGDARRITGPLSAGVATLNRLAVQGSSTNGGTLLPILPNGTSRNAAIDLHDKSTADGALFQLATLAGEARISAADAGGGAPFLTVYTGAAERVRIDNAGLMTVAVMLQSASGVATAAGGARTLRLGASGPDIYCGSGVPTISAAQGSLYLRTDGSSTTTRMYVNQNGSTTWTAVTTAA